MTSKYQLIAFTILAGFTGWIGHAITQIYTSPSMRITRVEWFDSGFRINVEFPADEHSKVTCVDGVDVVIERADGREVRVSGPISLDAALNPVFNVNFTPTDCPSALSEGDRFRLRWRLGIHHEARLTWLTEHLPRQWRPRGKWFYGHTKDNQLVISDWFTLVAKPGNIITETANKPVVATAENVSSSLRSSSPSSAVPHL